MSLGAMRIHCLSNMANAEEQVKDQRPHGFIFFPLQHVYRNLTSSMIRGHVKG